MKKVAKEKTMELFSKDFVAESLRLLGDHQEKYHGNRIDRCRICRSLRRSMMGGVQ